jgi:hypothetical protein
MSGRASFLFDRDRQVAAPCRFVFPTLLVRKHPNDQPAELHGMVAYSEVLSVVYHQGLSPSDRRKFADRPGDWEALFSIHPRLTMAEIELVTGLHGQELDDAFARNGIEHDGHFLVRSTSMGRAKKSAVDSSQSTVTVDC